MIWKVVPETNGMYEVSDQGDIRSWHKRGSRTGERTDSPRLLKPNKTGPERNYLAVYVNGRKRKVYQLVLEAFVGPKPSSIHEVRHLDGNPFNNSVDNLAWGTKSENTEDKWVSGSHPYLVKPGAKITQEDADLIRKLYATGDYTQKELGDRYGINFRTVSAIVHRKIWF